MATDDSRYDWTITDISTFHCGIAAASKRQIAGVDVPWLAAAG